MFRFYIIGKILASECTTIVKEIIPMQRKKNIKKNSWFFLELIHF